MTATAALLDVQVQRKRFGAREVLADLRLRVDQGEIVSLVGASGCGKSTLLRLIAGLDRDFAGRIVLDGRCVEAPTRDIRFVFQEPRLFPWLNVAANVAFDFGGAGAGAGGGGGGGGRNRGDRNAELRERVRALLDEVGLSGLSHHLPKQLSGGQAQRVAIARGLFVRPRVLLLDEPFSAVDAFTRVKLQDLLLQVVRAHGIAVLLVTHDIEEAVHLSDRVLVLEAGPGRIRTQVRMPHPPPPPHPRDHADTAAAIAEVRDALRAAHAF